MTESEQPPAPPTKVRLVRGKPVADVDALRKVPSGVLPRQQASVRVRALQTQLLQRECLGPTPTISVEVPSAKSKG